jgi:MFS family permease
MALLKAQWHISPTGEGLVASTALLASAFGALLFGRVADMVGRKRIYGYEVLVLALGATASAFSPGIWWLILFRVIRIKRLNPPSGSPRRRWRAW